MESPTLTMREWVAALRSGEWRQGQSRLCTIAEDGSKSYCCLGVALALQGRLHKHGSDLADPDLTYYAFPAKPFLSERIKYDQFYDIAVFPTKGNKFGNVSSMNDAGMSFNQIADALEHTYPELCGVK